MASGTKLLILALDAASPDLLRTWAADGTMPALARLMADGLVGETRSVDGLYVGATWPSFSSGHHPGNHGLYWLDRLIPGTYRMLRAGPRELGRRPAFWEVVSGSGKDVLVMDVPLTRRSPGLRGGQIVEWGVHDPVFGFQTSSSSLRREVLGLVGPHPAPARCDAPRRSLDQYRSLADALARGAAARAVLTRHLLSTRPWDLAIQVFGETHCAGHQLWHFHDPVHPGYQPEVRATTGDLLQEVYRAVDRAIEAILSRVAEDVTVLVLALHGMSFSCGAGLALPEVLSRLGMGPGPGSEPGTPVTESRWKKLYHTLPESVRAPIYRWRQHVNSAWLARGTPLALDPERTKAFAIGLGTGAPVSGIRLNLAGREPRGIVNPGAEEERCCATLVRDLAELTDPETGRRLVSRVVRTSALFEGPDRGWLPDLLVEWDPTIARGTSAAGSGAGSVWRVSSPKIGEVAVDNHYCRTGEHRPEGLFVCRIPGGARGVLAGVRSILDFAPTVARFFGTEMPSSDGEPIGDLLR